MISGIKITSPTNKREGNMFTIKKAERKQSKLRLALCGPSNSGKTFSALLIASGIGGKVVVIDTENGSADLYASLTDYSVLRLQPPFSPERYVSAMRHAEDAGFDVIIIDSLSHAWSGTGGTLEKHSEATARDPRGNSYAAWRSVTPGHNALVDAILQSPCHVIANMRAKTEYVQEKDENGKTVVRKVGMGPVMRDGIEYEFTLFLELDQNHNAFVSKTRIPELDNKVFTPTKETGEQLMQWLNQGEKDYTYELLRLKKIIKETPDVDLSDFEAVIEFWKEQEPASYEAGMKYIEERKNASTTS